MNISDEFWVAATAAAHRPATAGPHLIGSRLAWAAAHVLNAEGAGISISADELPRLPWGASCESAATTERLQLITGEGPAVTASTHQVPIMAPALVIAPAWPAFADQLRRRAPYRSVFSLPLTHLGAVNLYFTDPDGCSRVDIADALAVTQQILAAMVDEQFVSTLDGAPHWRIPSSARRTEVCVAVGMLTAALGADHADALALLRAHAFATDQDVEDAADAVITGTLHPYQLAS